MDCVPGLTVTVTGRHGDRDWHSGWQALSLSGLSARACPGSVPVTRNYPDAVTPCPTSTVTVCARGPGPCANVTVTVTGTR